MKILLVVFLLFGFLVPPSTEIRCYNCTYNADVEGLPCLDPRKPGNKVDKTYGSYCEVITSPQSRGFMKIIRKAGNDAYPSMTCSGADANDGSTVSCCDSDLCNNEIIPTATPATTAGTISTASTESGPNLVANSNALVVGPAFVLAEFVIWLEKMT